uniref:Uncharacterized protein n=1 Tax=Echeneis naucrates TaxID=173247 RepID=A0A665TDB9_ECHNA
NNKKQNTLGGQFLGLSLLQLSDAGYSTYLFISVIVVGLDGFHKLGKCTFILTRKEQNQTTLLRVFRDGTALGIH